jgi:hypothetical protein
VPLVQRHTPRKCGPNDGHQYTPRSPAGQARSERDRKAIRPTLYTILQVSSYTSCPRSRQARLGQVSGSCPWLKWPKRLK